MNGKWVHAKRMLGSAAAAAIMLSVCPTAIPCYAGEILGRVTFEDGIGLPWHTSVTPPAYLDFEISDGSYQITIQNNGGEDVGGESRWDCQFRHRDLKFYGGDSYTVKAEMTTDQTGEIYTKIGNYGGDIELWHNGYGMLNEKYAVGWNCIGIKAGQTLKIDSTWTAAQSLELADWAWQFGGAGPHQAEDCFPEGTVLKFNYLSIVNNSRDNHGTASSDMWTRLDSDDIYLSENDAAVAVNHQGYHTAYSKKATVHSLEPLDQATIYLIQKETGNAVYQKSFALTELDAASGEYTAVIDFTDVRAAGEYYFTFNPTDKSSQCSPVFEIGENLYDDLLKNSLNYFYQSRSCDAIEEAYITSLGKNEKKEKLARKAMGKTDTAYIQTTWVKEYGADGSDVETEKTLSADKGWFDGTDFKKSSKDGAYGAWMLQNLYEWSKTHDSKKFEDGSEAMTIPESDNAVPDLLDEARYEMEFLFDMIAAEDDAYAGMVYHEMADHKTIGIPARCWEYQENRQSIRLVRPVTTDATLYMAAAAAQASRLWNEYDGEFAELCLTNAKTAFAAAQENPTLVEGGSFMSTANIDFSDLYYWAAAELYATTGEEIYLAEMEKQQPVSEAKLMPSDTRMLGTFSLILNDKTEESSEKYLTDTADALLEIAKTQGFGLPYQTEQSEADLNDDFADRPNSIVAENSIVLAYAYDLTENKDYLLGATEGLDYLLGRNPIGISYVTDAATGSRSVSKPTHIFWANSVAESYPCAPDGVLVSGPSDLIKTTYLKAAGYNDSVADLKYYADAVDSDTTNSVSAVLNAPLAWIVSFAQDQSTTEIDFSGTGEDVAIIGDANADGGVDISDAILVYRIAAEDTSIQISDKGKELADCNKDGKLTAEDGSAIIRIIAKLD